MVMGNICFRIISSRRVASGEAFAYSELKWITDVWCDTVLVARERYRLTPDGEAVRALRTAIYGELLRKRLRD
jgi:urease accessory protein UreH